MLCNGEIGFWEKVLTKTRLSFTTHEAPQSHNFCVLSYHGVKRNPTNQKPTEKKSKLKQNQIEGVTRDLHFQCIAQARRKYDFSEVEFSNSVNRRETPAAELTRAPAQEALVPW